MQDDMFGAPARSISGAVEARFRFLRGEGADRARIALEWAALRPAGGFQFIMADPPWKFADWSDEGNKSKSPVHHYDCQPLSWIRSLPFDALAADNCVLWLWATNPMLPHAIETLEWWGFEFKTAGHWVKTTRHGKIAFGTGHLLRSAGEPFLIGTRGRPKTSRSVRSVVMAEATGHSRKPDAAYEAAERLMPGVPRIEVFSRRNRPNWSAWGDEVGKFDDEAA